MNLQVKGLRTHVYIPMYKFCNAHTYTLLQSIKMNNVILYM